MTQTINRAGLEVLGRWVRARIPPRHAEFAESGRDLEPHQCEWRDRARAVVDAGCIALLCGPRGTGKTQVAACVARQFLVDLKGPVLTDRPVIYTRADEMFRRLRQWDGGEAAEFDKGLKHAHLLIVDELQDRGETDFEDRNLNRIVDARYGERRPTVLIANLEPGEIARRLGLSVASRIAEGGGAIRCDGPYFRTADAT